MSKHTQCVTVYGKSTKNRYFDLYERSIRNKTETDISGKKTVEDLQISHRAIITFRMHRKYSRIAQTTGITGAIKDRHTPAVYAFSDLFYPGRPNSKQSPFLLMVWNIIFLLCMLHFRHSYSSFIGLIRLHFTKTQTTVFQI